MAYEVEQDRLRAILPDGFVSLRPVLRTVSYTHLDVYKRQGFPEAEAMRLPAFVADYIRPLFCEGRGPFRWTCLSGDPADLKRTDELAMELFGDDPIVGRDVYKRQPCVLTTLVYQ